MPKAYDRHRLTVTHDPNRRVDFVPPHLPKDRVSLGELIKLKHGIDLSGREGLIDSLGSEHYGQMLVQRIIAPFTHLLNPLFGNEEQGNLLSAGAFVDADSMSVGAGWSFDETVGRTTLGAARFDATGDLGAIRANKVAVAEDQRLDSSVWLKWAGVSASGVAFKLDLIALADDTIVSTTTLGSVSSPAADQASWLHMSGAVYLVPAGVTHVQLRLVVQNTTAGTIWFDDAELFKTTKVRGLVNDTLTSLFGGTTVGSRVRIQAIPTDDLTPDNVGPLRNLSNYITQQFFGDDGLIGTVFEDAREAMRHMFEVVLDHTRRIQAIETARSANAHVGKQINIDFRDYPDGPLPSIFDVTYSGSGTSTLGVLGGKSSWTTLVNDAARTALVRYNVAPTDTDFQVVRGTMAQPPQLEQGGNGVPRVWALARMNAAADSYVWARAYASSFLNYRCDIGCTVAGVDTVWDSNIPLGWNTDLFLVAGVGTTARRYQIVAGTKVVRDYTETGTTSQLGASYRYWGAKSELKVGTSTPRTPGTVTGSSVSDNAPPNMVGPGGHMYRTSTTNVSYAAGWNILPSSFFGVTLRCSDDITASLTDGSFTVTKEGSYTIVGAITIDGFVTQVCGIGVAVNGTVTQAGPLDSPNNDTSGMTIGATFTEYLLAGDVVKLATYRRSGTNNSLTGEATGTQTRFSITAANLSFA